jgi:hypothetical protein
MYPAQAFLDGLYDWDDLPDIINYGDDFENPAIIFEKQPKGTIDPFDGAERIYFANVEGESRRIVAESPYFNNSTQSTEIITGWQYQDYIGGNEWGWPGGNVQGEDCLISTTQVENIFDNFANSYSISGPISGIATRRSVPEGENLFLVNCQYIGTGLSLRYSSTTYKWQLNGNPKIGFQNTPVGSYAGGYSVS